MPITKQKKHSIVTKYQQHPTDTGSTSVQVAILTERIGYISSHLSTNSKDFSGERGLLKLVGQRKRLLKYLKNENFGEYQKVVKQLEVRK